MVAVRSRESPRYLRYARAALLFVLCMSLSSSTEAQPALHSHPFEANAWHTLTCRHNQRYNCSWEMRRGGDSTSFRPVELATEFVRAGLWPGDIQIFLNEDTKGTYKCVCRMPGDQTALRRTVYFYSASHRFQCFPDEVVVTNGEPLNVSVCYLPYLPEAPSLSTVTLVQEASGNRTIAFLRNYSAHYIVPNPKPGSYHFQVTTGEYGDIASASFNVTIEDRNTTTTATSPQGPTDALDEWVLVIAIILPLLAGALLLLFIVALVIFGVWKWKKAEEGNRGNNLHHEEDGVDHLAHADIAANIQGDGGDNYAPAIAVDNLQDEDDGAANLEPAVPDDIHGEGDGADNFSLANALPDNLQDEENNSADNLPFAESVPDDHLDEIHGAVEMEEALPLPEEEEFRESRNHPSAVQCTDHNDRYYAANAVLRIAPSKHLGVDHAERIKRPWAQHLANSPIRSETDQSLVTEASYVQASVEGRLNEPKPF